MYCRVRFASRLASTTMAASFSPSACSRVSSPIASTSSVSFWNQRYRSLSFSSSLRSLRCSAPRDWRSPGSLRVLARTSVPVVERFHRRIATTGIDRTLPVSVV